MKIGFIGLGIMGTPMAKNLLKAGHELVVCGHNKANVQSVCELGNAREAANGKEVAQNVDIIITMLQNSPNVEEVVCGKDGILESGKEGTIIIDMSSISPIASQKIAFLCEENGIEYLDAPVSGGEPKAIDGTLAIIVGGKEEIYHKVYNILMEMGSSATYCGTSGAGNTAKLANQIIVALNIAAVSEAFMLSTRAGIDPELVFEAIKGGLAGSAVLDAKIPKIIGQNFEPGFRIDLHIKDLNNAIETANAIDSPIPLTDMVMSILGNLSEEGYGADDHSAIARYYQNLTNTIISKTL